MAKNSDSPCDATITISDTEYTCDLSLGHKEEAHVNEASEIVWAQDQ